MSKYFLDNDLILLQLMLEYMSALKHYPLDSPYCRFRGPTLLKIAIVGGKSLVLWSEKFRCMCHLQFLHLVICCLIRYQPFSPKEIINGKHEKAYLNT